MIKVKLEKKELQEISHATLRHVDREIRTGPLKSFDNIFGKDLRKVVGRIDVSKSDFLKGTFSKKIIKILETNGRIDFDNNLFFSEKYKNGMKLTAFLEKVIKLVKNFQQPDPMITRKIAADTKIDPNSDEYGDLVANYSKQSAELFSSFLPKTPVDSKDLYSQLNSSLIDYKNALAEFGDGPYILILSRHPVDVIRMADHEKTQSCHSPNNEEYFKCAIQEAKGHGFVAYAVREKDYKKIENMINTKEEIFADKERNVGGIEPVSRGRIRKFFIETPLKDYTIAAPELSFYGLKSFSNIFYTKLKELCIQFQQEQIRRINVYDAEELMVQPFTSYFDTKAEEILAGIGIEIPPERFSLPYDKEESTKIFYNLDTSDIIEWIDKNGLTINSDYSFAKRRNGEANEFLAINVRNNYKYFKQISAGENKHKIAESLRNSYASFAEIYTPTGWKTFFAIKIKSLNPETFEAYFSIYFVLSEIYDAGIDSEMKKIRDFIMKFESELSFEDKDLSKHYERLAQISEAKKSQPKTDIQYGYDFSKEKSNTRYKTTDLIKHSEKYKNIIEVYQKSTPDVREFYKKWYETIQGVVKQIAEKNGIDFIVAACVYAILSPGNRTRMNIQALERTIENFQNSKNPGDSDYKKVFNTTNAIKALAVLRDKTVELADSPKVSVFFKSIVDPTTAKNKLVLDGHAINIWKGTKVILKGARVTKEERETVISDYKKAAKILGVSLQELQAVTWFIWKNTKDN